MLSFTRAKASRADAICINVFPDEYDVYDAYAHVALCTGYPESEWIYNDLEQYIESIILYTEPKNGYKYFATLSAEGEFTIFGDDGLAIETIPGAGIERSDRTPPLGRLTALRQVGDLVYACGHHGQIYRRMPDQSWSLLTAEALTDFERAATLAAAAPTFGEPGWAEWIASHRADAAVYGHIFYDVNGRSADDLYVAGEFGALFHWNGKNLQRLDSGTPEGLVRILIETEDRVWICGRNGTLLRGNARDGFRDVSGINDNQSFSSIVLHEGVVHVASSAVDVGVFRYTEEEGLKRIEQDLGPIHTLDVAEGVLWAVGLKAIHRYGGHEWKRIEYPGDTLP